MSIRFPQDFPAHLDSLAPSAPVSGASPLGSHPLSFCNMHSTQFEQFCWWLLQRDYEIDGCQLIGGSGRYQGGIDLFAYARGGKAQLTVFECKCWKEFKSAALKDAVARFLKGPWATPGVRFVLILAQDSLEQFAEAWREARQALHAREIVGEVWTGVDLTERVRVHPDILVRFFPDATVTMYCGEWMRRVDFWTQLQKAMVDERSAVRKLARQFVDRESRDSTDSGIDRIYSSPEHWGVETPWVQIDALLPYGGRASGSIAIVVKKPSTSGFTVALSQDWLLKNLLARVGAPAEHSYRPFIYGPVSGQPDAEISIDLNSARLQVPPEGLEAMCDALDRLTPVYTDALRALEKDWDAEGFPFIGSGDNTVVAMCSISGWVWQQVLAFALEHDVDAGDSEWHTFDRNPNYLKVFTKKAHADFEPGYHAFIHGREDIDGLSYGNDVVLTWEPPTSVENFKLAARHWMQCSEALRWLRDKLLPAVGQWLIASEIRKVMPWRRATQRGELARLWADRSRLRERRNLPLLDDERYRMLGLVRTSELLQGDMGHGAPQLYLNADEIRKLYRALATVMEGRRGYVPYIASNLGLREECETHRDLTDALVRRANADELAPTPTAYGVRHMLSALLEGLNDDDRWLAPDAVESVFAALVPLMQHHDLVQLYERHSRWT
jgi:hypothetical protein